MQFLTVILLKKQLKQDYLISKQFSEKHSSMRIAQIDTTRTEKYLYQ